MIAGTIIGFRMSPRAAVSSSIRDVPGEPAASVSASTTVTRDAAGRHRCRRRRTSPSTSLRATVDELAEVELAASTSSTSSRSNPKRSSSRGFATGSVGPAPRFAGYLRSVRGRKIDDDTWDELEEALLLADVGMATSQRLLDAVRDRAKVEDVTDCRRAPRPVARRGRRRSSRRRPTARSTPTPARSTSGCSSV